ncbi:MAG TPA: Holliday junction resolvase RuvX [Acetobacteraceae bacterium]|nr:Holliday junction resolvase RuvX [Acetobacteraceae bacterium]
MILDLPALLVVLAPRQRLIGIDPGRKSIGLALSDVNRTVASPVATLKRGRLRVNAAEIVALARREDAGGLVVGLPLSLDGAFGPAAQAARDWTRDLSDATGLPATLWDERLSTATIQRMLIEEADLGRARRAAIIDRMAAAYILQAALDAGQALRQNAAARQSPD